MNFIQKYGIVFAALIFGSVLLSGQAKVSFNHNHIMPTLKTLLDQQAYSLHKSGNVTEVILSRKIENAEKYHGLLLAFITAKKGDVINLHLAGNGGSVATVIQLINAISSSKATVNTIIEGPVYSAHAVLAMSGKSLTIHSATAFMFHRMAVGSKMGGDICEKYKGKKDRRQDAESKCQDNVEYLEAALNTILWKTTLPYLTFQERADYFEGHDIYVSGDDMIKRVQAGPLFKKRFPEKKKDDTIYMPIRSK